MSVWYDGKTTDQKYKYVDHLEEKVARHEVVLAAARLICRLYDRGDGSDLDKAVNRLAIELALLESGN